MEHLLKHWNDVSKEFIGKYILLFLDYDGTLTPIADTPEKAVISRENSALLAELSRLGRCKIAIISGRSLKDIKDKIGLKAVIYSGNHGLEIEGPGIKFTAPLPAAYKTAIKRIRVELDKKICSIKGAFVEDKGLSLSLHFRLVNKEDVPLIKNAFHEAAAVFLVKNQIRTKPGKMVFEVRPAAEWDKGKIVLWLLAREKFILKGKPVEPVYIGDDVTDEDAFRALGKRGLNVFVGRPRDSAARYYLADPGEVTDFLREILKLKMEAGNAGTN